MPRLEPLVPFCAACALVSLLTYNGPSQFNAVSSSNRTATANKTESITPINVLPPIKRTYKKKARHGVHIGSGLNGPASLALEVAAYRRIETSCTADQRRHFPHIVEYVPGQYLNITSAGEIVWRFVFRHGYDGSIRENFNITKANAIQQIDLITDCLERARIYHLDIYTPPQQCKNVALLDAGDDEDGHSKISLIDFDLVAFEEDGYDQSVRSQKLQDSVRGRNRSEYSTYISEEILKCAVGERDDDILSIKPDYVRKEKETEEVSIEKANMNESRRPKQLPRGGSLLKKTKGK